MRKIIEKKTLKWTNELRTTFYDADLLLYYTNGNIE